MDGAARSKRAPLGRSPRRVGGEGCGRPRGGDSRPAATEPGARGRKHPRSVAQPPGGTQRADAHAHHQVLAPGPCTRNVSLHGRSAALKMTVLLALAPGFTRSRANKLKRPGGWRGSKSPLRDVGNTTSGVRAGEGFGLLCNARSSAGFRRFFFFIISPGVPFLGGQGWVSGASAAASGARGVSGSGSTPGSRLPELLGRCIASPLRLFLLGGARGQGFSRQIGGTPELRGGGKEPGRFSFLFLAQARLAGAGLLQSGMRACCVKEGIGTLQTC